MALSQFSDIATIEQAVGRVFTTEYGLALGCRADYACNLDEDVVEVEVGQTHPQTNILKYWPWLEEDKNRRVLLVQLFYENTRRRRLTEWVGKRLVRELPKQLAYVAFDAPLEQRHVAQIVELAGAGARV